MRYLLDTNICIYIIKRQPPEVLHRLEFLPQGSAVMSVVTYAELRAGLEIQTANRAQDERVLAYLCSAFRYCHLSNLMQLVLVCCVLPCATVNATPWTVSSPPMR